MINSITFTRGQNTKYDELLDVAEHVAKTYGSATNAIAEMAIRSSLYREAIDEIGAVAGPKGKAKRS